MLLKPAFVMELVLTKWVCAYLLCSVLIFSPVYSVVGLRGDSKVRAVNLGGWLVVEGWIKPSLFDGIPNGDMLNGTMVQLKSVTLDKYVSAENGGGTNVSVSRDVASSWEMLRLWRVSESEFQFCTSQGQILTCDGGEGCSISATTESPSISETFYVERNGNGRVHIKIMTGTYLQATMSNQIVANYAGKPGWDDNAATFEMTIVTNNLRGDYQLANGYGHNKAKDVLQRHRNSFISIEDFSFLSRHGINTVRIPVGWWIAYDPDPPAPFIGGTLEALDNAFSWAQSYNIRCIIDLHAAPGSQNGMEHSSSRDGSTDWPNSDAISQTLLVINFLTSRYVRQPALLAIELLNEPSVATVPLNTLVSYYKQGYEIVRKYSSTTYVIICQRIGNADPSELFQANIGSHNLVVDLHYYNLFDNFFVNMSPTGNIQFIYKSKEPQLHALNSANGPLVFIGEWVNEWSVTNASQSDYQDFGKVQLEVYSVASFGWAYWTLKNDKKHWDFEWMIKNNYLQLSSSSNKRNVNCLVLLVLLFYLHHIL